MKVFIVAAARTPITQFKSGALAKLSAPQLGAHAIKAALIRARLQPEKVDEVFFGQVLQGGAGQAPARQAALGAGLPESVICTTVNKVCASGMKSIMLGAQSIKAGGTDVLVAGGMESMSNVPWLMERQHKALGNLTLLDGIVYDGLTDAYGKYHMGLCAENTCKKLNITREQQDEYAISSYERATEANKSGTLAREIVPVEIKSKKTSEAPVLVTEDEEFKRIDLKKLSSLKPAFQKDGTVTAANASTLNDGAAATVIASTKAIEELRLEPLAEILSYADAACSPIDFPIAPSLGIPKALKAANLNIRDVSRWEINEAFSAVVLANIKILNLDNNLVNIDGGAVSLGHPIGMSGTRIVNNLVLHLKVGQIGVASICNGGGGASTVVIKKIREGSY